jgi:large subunit ribosomal protein L7/L12
MAEEKKKESKEKATLSKKSEDILKAVEEMSVLELNSLVKALEEKFGVSAAASPAMVAPAGAAVSAGGEAGASAEEKSSFDVVLASAGEKRIEAIKAVRELNQNLALKEAKELVDSAPKPVLEGVKKEEAEEAKKKLEAVGCQVDLK